MWILGGLLIGALLGGCASSSSSGVQVVDRNKSGASSRQPVTSGQYTVQRGDTLFSIAFRYGWDWKALAARNGIPPPYVIRPGQKIRFGNGASQPAAPTAVASASTPVVTTMPTPSAPVLIVPQPVTGTPTTAPRPVTPTVATTPTQSVDRSPSGWAWPANGVLIGKFSSNGSLNKGIDIAGELGQPVLAASDGSVVYAGSGLRGYGELVIIKHSDTYVSAYGHNRRLLVREGEQVKAGQTVAEMGSTGTDRVKLHFEIRRQGKPVDPLQYLPRR
nr:peptidoglycan DD-metalloendopeptidase family protein [Pseudomonas kuykendallii]